MKYPLILTVLFLIFSASAALGRPEFPAEWQQVYPNSRSADRGCQLCHVNVEGGEPWNTYGFEIRDSYRELIFSTDIQGAIRSVESNNSDGDALNRTNLEEIQMNLDPGWSPGPTNAWIYSDGIAIEGNFPPFNEPSTNDELCFPVVLSEGIFALICL